MPPRPRAPLLAPALLALALTGCGGPGDLPASPPGLAEAEAALAAGHLDQAARLFEAARAKSGTASLDSRGRLAVLRGLTRCRMALGEHAEAQRLVWEQRSLGARELEHRRWAAALALLTGRDLERSRDELAAVARDPEDLALLGRLGLRLGEPPPGPPASAGPQAALLASELHDAPQAARVALETHAKGHPDPALDPAVLAEVLALHLDTGEPPARVMTRLPKLSWVPHRQWLEARATWQVAHPGSTLPGQLRRLRLHPARSADLRVTLAVEALEGPLPAGPRTSLGAVPEGQLTDRDPVSPRRGVDSHPRVTLIRWPGLTPAYLEASLAAGHFPYLRALAHRGATVHLAPSPKSQPPGQGRPPQPLPAGTLEVDATGARVHGPTGPAPWSPPGERLRRPDPAGTRARLFARGLGEPAATALAARVVTFDLAVEAATQVAAVGREELRPPLTLIELPPWQGLAAALTLLQSDCRPAHETLAAQLVAPLTGFEATMDQLAARVDQLVGRLAPTLDRDDHVLVVAAGTAPQEGELLLAYGPAFEAGATHQGLPAKGGPRDLAAWLAAGRRAPAPAGWEPLVTPSPVSPFRAPGASP